MKPLRGKVILTAGSCGRLRCALNTENRSSYKLSTTYVYWFHVTLYTTDFPCYSETRRNVSNVTQRTAKGIPIPVRCQQEKHLLPHRLNFFPFVFIQPRFTQNIPGAGKQSKKQFEQASWFLVVAALQTRPPVCLIFPTFSTIGVQTHYFLILFATIQVLVTEQL